LSDPEAGFVGGLGLPISDLQALVDAGSNLLKGRGSDALRAATQRLTPLTKLAGSLVAEGAASAAGTRGPLSTVPTPERRFPASRSDSPLPGLAFDIASTVSTEGDPKARLEGEPERRIRPIVKTTLDIIGAPGRLLGEALGAARESSTLGALNKIVFGFRGGKTQEEKDLVEAFGKHEAALQWLRRRGLTQQEGFGERPLRRAGQTEGGAEAVAQLKQAKKEVKRLRALIERERRAKEKGE